MEQIYATQRWLETVEQVSIRTSHELHAGVYARMVWIPAGVVAVGVKVKVPTLVMTRGDAAVFDGERWVELSGDQVLCGAAGRKQIFVTRTDFQITMAFATAASDIAAVEAEFTDEVDDLMWRAANGNATQTTGE